MGRSANRGRAGWWRAVCSMLLAVGGLTACGPDRSDAALAESAVGPPSPPGGECRRWTTCVPENPCHTGWVTGCRANVPICTDIGGWLSNGTTCGTDAVCSMGECEPCAAGESCVYAKDMYGNPDACKLGAIACGSGQPVCEYQGPATDGTACGSGGGSLFCKAGQCSWCDEGVTGCQLLEAPCHRAVLTQCATTGGTCTDTGAFQPPGSWCADGRACTSGGECVACTWYAACTPPPQPPTSCIEQSAEGYTYCSDGPQCVPYSTWWKADGTPCGDGVCQSGTCVPRCVPDLPCTPSNACYSGRTVCDGYSAWCEQRDRLPDGTSCGVDAVCSGGSCTSCGPATWCQSPTPCYGSGTISCATGQCEPTPPSYEAASCGVAGESCQAGACTDDGDARLVVRSASWTADLTGTKWSRCSTGEGPGSRRTTDTYGVGTLTHVEETFASADCSGTPESVWSVDATVTLAGDRYVTWGGTQPPGTPWYVTATAIHVTGEDPVLGTLDLKFLVWVNDWVSPRQIYQGETDHSLAWDGYPALLVPETHPLQEIVACTAGEACSPGYPTCEVFQIDCSGTVPACVGTGAVLPDGARCGDFMACSAGACLTLPTKTVTGTAGTTYWPDAGAEVTTDPAPLQISALQFSADAMVILPGEVHPDGTFSIPNVYEVPYLLEIRTPTSLKYVATTVSTLDLGIDVLGRRDVAWAITSSPVWFDVDGLVPWSRGDVLEFASSNAGVAAMPFGPQESTAQPVGVPQLTGWFDWFNKPLVDASAGDVAYVFQGATTIAPTGERVTAASGYVELTDLVLPDGAGGTVDVTLLPCDGVPGAISADWRRSEFEAYASQAHPAATLLNHRLVVGARPHAAPAAPGFRAGNLAAYPGVPLLVVQAAAGTGDAVLTAQYGRFLPSLWREYRHDRLNFGVNYWAPGAVNSARLNAPLGYDVAADLVAGDPAAPFVVTPVIGPPTGLLIAGLDAWSGVSGVGTTPRISWTAPIPSPLGSVLFPGAALQYAVTVYELQLAPDGLGTRIVPLFEGITNRTMLRLPGTNMWPGGTYVVEVRANLTTDSVVAPLRRSAEQAFATVLSAPFTP